jgi:hypothetical protein
MPLRTDALVCVNADAGQRVPAASLVEPLSAGNERLVRVLVLVPTAGATETQSAAAHHDRLARRYLLMTHRALEYLVVGALGFVIVLNVA